MLSLCLIALLVVLQVRLFKGDGSILEVRRLKQDVAHDQETIQALKERNQMLAAEVHDLKYRMQALEERARTDLGMIRKGETFYQFADSSESK